MNGHLNVQVVDRETFVQGHSKDGHRETSTRGEGQTGPAEDEKGQCEHEDEDEDEDEEEPALKYERLEGAAAELLEKDTASAVAVSQKVLASMLMQGLHIHANVTDRCWGCTTVWCTSWTI